MFTRSFVSTYFQSDGVEKQLIPSVTTKQRRVFRFRSVKVRISFLIFCHFQPAPHLRDLLVNYVRPRQVSPAGFAESTMTRDSQGRNYLRVIHKVKS